MCLPSCWRILGRFWIRMRARFLDRYAEGRSSVRCMRSTSRLFTHHRRARRDTAPVGVREGPSSCDHRRRPGATGRFIRCIAIYGEGASRAWRGARATVVGRLGEEGGAREPRRRGPNLLSAHAARGLGTAWGHDVRMLTKALLFTIIGACGVAAGAASNHDPVLAPEPDGPSDFAPPPEDPPEDQHFCCATIDTKAWTGSDCVPIGKEHMANCDRVLYCPGKWANEMGHVICD
jgi:hypothetical protein